jgi:hypothetical protein
MPFENAASIERIGDDQQIHVAVRLRLAIGARAKQDDLFWVEGRHDAPNDLTQ